MMIHVMEPLREDEKLGFHERRCTEPDRGEERVYHVKPAAFLCGDFMCMACGAIFTRPGKRKSA